MKITRIAVAGATNNQPASPWPVRSRERRRLMTGGGVTRVPASACSIGAVGVDTNGPHTWWRDAGYRTRRSRSLQQGSGVLLQLFEHGLRVGARRQVDDLRVELRLHLGEADR